MKTFLDTSVLVAAVLEKYVSHIRAFAVLDRVQNGRDQGFVSAHSLAEMYCTLTKLPVPFRHSPEQALLNIEENVLKHFKICALTDRDYVALIREAALSGIQSGTVYDAVLLKSAGKIELDRIYTLNPKHFEAVAKGKQRSLLCVP
ncbi:MAG TPA: PIN domain-containing protein [Candidatus Acidoferrum sp.]|nr:PIN domain-containing protein [Candidatus Acidoferrum sp.]